MLLDDVLLDIFDFYRSNHNYTHHPVWKWHILVHVCQRWRQVVFASPQRLKLQIPCTYGTPFRKTLGIWPAFPIVLDFRHFKTMTPYDEDNAIIALEHSDRVCSVWLNASGEQLRTMATLMQKPFPVLTLLEIVWNTYGSAPVLPADILGGSASRLQEITLIGVPFPALGTFLLSAGDLVKLYIFDPPPIGYISPETMVACLAALPRLEIFVIKFRNNTPRPDRIRPPPAMQTVLPALTSFGSRAAIEYLEDLLAQIDSPQLNRIDIEYLSRPGLVDFQVPQLSKFIDRSLGHRSTLLRCADVSVSLRRVNFVLCCHANYPGGCGPHHSPVQTSISCAVFDLHTPRTTYLFSQFSTILSNVVHLKLEADRFGEDGPDPVEWPHILSRFPTAQTLRVSRTYARLIALVLDDITAEMAVQVLPTLDLIYLETRRLPPAFLPSVEKFVAVRRLSGRPITVVDTEVEFNERLKTYITK